MPIWVFPNQHSSITGSPPRSTRQRTSRKWVTDLLKLKEPVPDCTSVKEVIDLVTREIVYKQLNPRVTTHVRAQKPTSLQKLYVADSGRGRESAWSRNTVNPQSTYQKPHRPFNGHKFQATTSSSKPIADSAHEPTSDPAPDKPTQAISSLPAASWSQTTH